MMDDIADALEAMTLAVRFDIQIKDTDKAVVCYRKAARFLDRALSQNAVPTEQILTYQRKVRECLERAAALEAQKEKNQQAESDRNIHQFHFLMQQALDADEAGHKDSALDMYMQAVELAVKLKDSDRKGDCNTLAKRALDRAEELKGIKFSNLSMNEPKRPAVTPTKAILQREQSVNLKVTGKYAYTEEEKEVLRMTSNINNNTFFPFMDHDLAERFQYAIHFEDRASELKLSAKQQKEFDCWIRPHEICSDPKLIVSDHVDCFSIKQTIVSDCSFVASLAVSALYETRFPDRKKIITNIIYPRNKHNQPVYNPFGKYMVKLHLNGVRRKVIIDDRLPFSRYGRLLCSYSSNKNEFWVSMLEKAYMKVMGGYDFPGSNSNIDLHALTGWIPERCSIRKDEPDFNADVLYEKIRKHLSEGDVLATVATGPLSDADADRTGLVATHAYAVLDVRLANGVKLLKLKNPWSHLRWRGNYSELDSAHWTPTLRGLLNYDPDSAAQYDNGVFWIDYASILNFFDVFYLNWKPDLFKYTFCTHQKWDAGSGPVKDIYTVGENPQFSLHVQGKGAVWLLLTRHITQIDDFRDNKEYITLLVYKNNGRRVYYRQEPPPYIDGVPINSPHYLCKIIVGDNSANRYTLVMSQYEKSRTILYTLRAYATCPFALNKLETYPYNFSIQGEWSGRNAGGCENHRQTYPNNPKFTINMPDNGAMVVELRGPKQYNIGIDVTVDSLDDPNVTAPFVRESSGAYRQNPNNSKFTVDIPYNGAMVVELQRPKHYNIGIDVTVDSLNDPNVLNLKPFVRESSGACRSGYAVLDLPSLPAGRYILTVSTFYPGQEGPFIIQLRTTNRITYTARN